MLNGVPNDGTGRIRSGQSPSRQLELFDPQTTDGGPGPPCLKCRYKDTIISPGVGPHHARVDCPQCKAWRWLPTPRPDRGGAA